MSPGRARVGRLLVVRAFASASSAPWAPARASASGAYARCDSESNDVADGIEGAGFTDVKDCEERADKPPKSPGRRVSGLSWGKASSGPDNYGGPGPGASSPAHRRAHEGLQPGGPCPVNAHGA